MIEHDGSRLFKYNYIIARLRQDIRDGKWGEDGRMPPERRLCEEYEVSRVTLRAALKQLRAEGAIEQRQGSGTYLKRHQTDVRERGAQVFRVLLIGKTPRFALEIDPYYSQLFLGFYRFHAPGRTFQFDTRLIAEKEDFAVHRQREGLDLSPYRGILCAFPMNEADLAWLDAQGKPYVFLGHPNILRQVPMVDIDNYQGMYMAAESLLRHGCRRPLLLYNGYSQPNLHMRLAGYRAALAKYGVMPETAREIEVGDKVSEEAEAAVDDALSSGREFDSVLAVCDWPALGAMNALKRHRFKVPEQIKLAVFDGFPWLLEGMRPHPMAIVQPFALMAEKALELLCRQPEPEGIVTQVLIRPAEVAGETV